MGRSRQQIRQLKTLITYSLALVGCFHIANVLLFPAPQPAQIHRIQCDPTESNTKTTTATDALQPPPYTVHSTTTNNDNVSAHIQTPLEDTSCSIPQRVRSAAAGYKWDALDEFFNDSEFLLSGINAGTSYLYYKENGSGGGTKGRPVLEIQQAFPTVTLSESVATSSTNSSKLCLVNAWLRQWQTSSTAGRATNTLFHHSLLSKISAPSFLHPQGYYFAGMKSTGKPLYEINRGFDADRPMAIRSQSKAFVAAVLLSLQDQKLLNIDDPVAKYLDSFKANSTHAKITLRMILSHTSGMKRYTADGKLYGYDPPCLTMPEISLGESTSMLLTDNLSFKPGETFWYTASAYQALGAVVEAVTGKSWHQVFEETIVKPVGLSTDTAFYNYWSTERNVANPLLSVGAISTANDFIKFIRMLVNNGTVVNEQGQKLRVLSHAAVIDMFTKQRHTATQGMSLGFANQNRRSIARPTDMGIVDPYTSQIASATWSPKLGYGLGVWINDDDEIVESEIFRRKKVIHTVGMFNTHVTIVDWGTKDPVIGIGFSFTRYDGCWTIAIIEFYKALRRL